MKRTKYTFKEPDQTELMFITVMELNHCVPIETLINILEENPRALRFYKERYNNYVYINYPPKGEIHAIKGNYVLVNNDDELLKRKYQLKALHNMICSKIALKSNIKTFGKLQLEGQIDMYDVLDKDSSVDELMNVKKILEELD